MNKGIAVITAVVVLTASSLALAEMKGKGQDMGKGMCPMCEKMGDGKGMMGGMMGMMNKSTMVASNDGGVILLSGKKLSKYDANLNLVKEVSLKGEEPAATAVKAEAPQAGDVDHAAHH